MKEKVYNLLKNLKNFKEVELVLNKIPADKSGRIIRGFILDYMEEHYSKEFEAWVEEY